MDDLDQIIIRIAAAEAYRLLSDGFVPTDAIKQATPGAWAQYRQDVLYRLIDSDERSQAG